jgi:hypothetical protein
MARPLRIEFKGALYHIIARGNEHRDIFLEDDNYEIFLGILEEMSKPSEMRRKYSLISSMIRGRPHSKAAVKLF